MSILLCMIRTIVHTLTVFSILNLREATKKKEKNSPHNLRIFGEKFEFDRDKFLTRDEIEGTIN